MVSSTSFFSQAVEACQLSSKVMLLTAIPVNACNLVSVVCCHHNLTTCQAISNIYSGKVHGGTPSTRHFLTGISGHLLKEMPRQVIRVGVLTFAKPGFEKYYHDRKDAHATLKTAILVSLLWGAGAAAINPFDTLRTMWQTGKGVRESLEPNQSLFRHLYAGALANGLRHTAAAWTFSYSELAADRCVEATPFDPHSMAGIVLKSPIQGVITTTVVFFPERLKNVLQLYPRVKEQAREERKSAYIRAFDHIVSHQGGRGLTRGLIPMMGSITLLTAGANYLLEAGRGNLNAAQN